MQHKQILSRAVLNSSTSIFQVLIVGLVYFFLYKYLLKTVGSEYLGLWSLIISTTSMGTIANSGISNVLTPQVAEEESQLNYFNILKLIVNGLIIILGFILIIAAIFKVFLINVLENSIPVEHIILAKSLINLSLLSLILNSIASIFLSVIDGLNKIFIKNIILALSSLLLLFCSFYFIGRYGIMGAVYAQIIQASFTLLFSILIVVYSIKEVKFFQLFVCFDKKIAKRLIIQGSKFQAISIALIFFDPTTKFLLSSYGGLKFVAYYEMANRLVTQVKSTIVLATQSLIPLVSKNRVTKSFDVGKIYIFSFKIVFILAFCVTVFVCFSIQFISRLWLGYFEPIFINFSIILSIGWFVNILSTPFYFINISNNKVNVNLISHLLMSGLNLILCFLLGKYLGNGNVVYGTALALIISSGYLIYDTFYKNEFNLNSFFSRYEYILIAILIAISGFSILYVHYSVEYAYISLALSFIVPLFALFLYQSKYFLFQIIISKLK